MIKVSTAFLQQLNAILLLKIVDYSAGLLADANFSVRIEDIEFSFHMKKIERHEIVKHLTLVNGLDSRD